MTIIACVLVVVVPIALIASLMCLKHDIEWSDYRVDILERDILSLKRQLDYQTDYVHNSKDALLDYFNLEIQRTPITVKKRGK